MGTPLLRALKGSDSIPAANSLLKHAKGWRGALAKVNRPWLEKAVELGARRMMRKLGGKRAERIVKAPPAFTIENLEDVWDITNPLVEKWLSTYTMRLSGILEDTTLKMVRDSVSVALVEGETIREMSDRIQSIFDGEMSDYRSNMIARTEMNRATSQGEFELVDQSGAFKAKYWIYFPDSCEFCEELGRIYSEENAIGMRDNFMDKGDSLKLPGIGKMDFDYEPVLVTPAHPHCVVPDADIVAHGIRRVMVAHYDGDVVKVHTAMGRADVTGGHLFLTDRGLCAARHLVPGDRIFAIRSESATARAVMASAAADQDTRRQLASVADGDFHNDGVLMESQCDVLSLATPMGTPMSESLASSLRAFGTICGLADARAEHPWFRARHGDAPPVLACGGEVVPVLSVEFRHYQGPVIDFETEASMYAVGGILASNCTVGDTKVYAPDVVRGYETLYDGPMITVRLATDIALTITPNHMLLTPNGFVKAQTLRKGDYVLCCTGGNGKSLSGADDNNGPPSIKEAIESLSVTPQIRRNRTGAVAEYFHGDGRNMNGDISIITADGFLKGDIESVLSQEIGDGVFASADKQLPFFPGSGPHVQRLLRMAHAADRIMGGRGEAGTFGGRRPTHANAHGRRPISDRNLHLQKMPPDYAPANAEPDSARFFRSARQVEVAKRGSVKINPAGSPLDTFSAEPLQDARLTPSGKFRDLLASMASTIQPTEIIDITTKHFSGHVYDLQTISSLYIGNTILLSNCRCEIGYVEAEEEPEEKVLKDFDESQHPRDESGRWSSGGSTTPTAAEAGESPHLGRSDGTGFAPGSEAQRAAAFVAQADAQIGELRTRFPGLRKLSLGHLHVHNDDSVSDKGKRLPGAVGLYRNGRIDLALSRSLGATTDELTLGRFTATRGVAGALAHELGHHVQDSVLPNTARKAWMAVWRQWSGSSATIFRGVSTYAASSRDEAFAESFAVYTHPRYAGQLPRPIGQFMDQYVAKLRKEKG